MKVVLPTPPSSSCPRARAVSTPRARSAEAGRAGRPRERGRLDARRTLPLADGESIRFLTTRDTQDPDALSVLRHSTAHLLAEAVMRLHPGVKIAIGPPIADGFYYDFEFPEPISESDLEAIEEEIRREIAEGRVWTREEVGRDEAIARFEAESQPVQGRARRHCRGVDLAVHAEATSPTSAADRTFRTPSRSRR
jgi:hypothetical protein